jgi:hypothetical protein
MLWCDGISGGITLGPERDGKKQVLGNLLNGHLRRLKKLGDGRAD